MPRTRWRPWLCRPRCRRPVRTAQQPGQRTIRAHFSWVFSFVEIGMAGGVGESRPERYAVAISALWYAIEAGAMAPGPSPPARARGHGTDGASVLHYHPTYDKSQHDAFRPARPGARRGARAPLRADRRHAQPRGAAEHGAVPRRAVRPDAR